MFVRISIAKQYLQLYYAVSGKVNVVVLCNAVKLMLLWCHLGNTFREF